MMNNRMMCRSSATLGAEPARRTQSTGSLWMPDEDAPRPRVSRANKATTGATLALIVGEPQAESQEESPEVPIVHIAHRVEWFAGPVAELPRWAPHISPDLVVLATEDE
jgi:hypothetical protein